MWRQANRQHAMAISNWVTKSTVVGGAGMVDGFMSGRWLSI
jgi:hypothetical protein